MAFRTRVSSLEAWIRRIEPAAAKAIPGPKFIVIASDPERQRHQGREVAVKWVRYPRASEETREAFNVRLMRIACERLPCSTRSVMRWLSMSDTFSATTSDTRRPAP